MTEKKKPTYDLKSIQDAASTMLVTRAALMGAAELGMTRKEIEEVVLHLTRKDFYKSVTTFANHAVWMDVYHGKQEIEWNSEVETVTIYIKFVQDVVAEFSLTSFKEKQE
ncbi:type II toxin-antitoxin system MqsR family toxin [Paracoccus sp. IB05]|uniref:type II toxin-antitoxin system MqsR family toxin n=1 Tax=Paracoccus sp. IB05 TaxID=2779367 RepID=UPI0018E7E3C0|nr:type II toxin-antitoxin system MqsR family toxin [Paracoccus sp. IB05]MBJ2152680.1 type II toxin-antitoxin system MqsR family toxin [Paracoccus sp. IB05]